MRSRFASYLCDNVFNVEETLAVIALYVGTFKLIIPLYVAQVSLLHQKAMRFHP